MCAGYTSAITFSASNNWFALSQETFIICVKMDTWTGDIQEEWWISFLVIFWYNAAFNRPSNRLTGPKSSPKNISHTNTIFKGRGDRGSSQITFLYDNHDCHDFLAKWNEMASRFINCFEFQFVFLLERPVGSSILPTFDTNSLPFSNINHSSVSFNTTKTTLVTFYDHHWVVYIIHH